MADLFSYVSILNPGFPLAPGPAPSPAGTFAYVSFLNPPSGGPVITVTVPGSTSYRDENNVSFGFPAPGIITATAGPQPRSVAWSRMGVFVGVAAPAVGIAYSEWAAGRDGYWGWVELP